MGCVHPTGTKGDDDKLPVYELYPILIRNLYDVFLLVMDFTSMEGRHLMSCIMSHWVSAQLVIEAK